jgi:hypothetical protein
MAPVGLFLGRNQVAPASTSLLIPLIKIKLSNSASIAQVKPKRISNHGCILMPGKGCLIRFKQSNLTTDLVYASSAEIHGEHLVFLHADGSLAALFLLELVESWSETDLKSS